MQNALFARARFLRAFVCLLALSAFAAPADAQDGSNVLLVVNVSTEFAEPIIAKYTKARNVPAENVVRLATAKTDEIERTMFEREIERPIAEWINRHDAQDRILYIVLTKGVPLRVRGSEGLNGTVASVDSELALLYRKLVGLTIQTAGRVTNPYFLGDRRIDQAQPFSHRLADIYLVCRLDGYTLADVLQLIDRGAAPAREGQFLLDQRASLIGDRGADMWLAAAAAALKEAGFSDRVVLESTPDVLGGKKQVLGYYSWGSNDPNIRKRRLDIGFVPGALAAMFVSTDARTFTAPPDTWEPGVWADPKTFYAGSPQSLTGDLIHDGATGAAGHVAEPYLDATIRPQILFPAYVRGFNLIESFYLAMPYLSWQTVVVGDPLCAPFRTQNMSSGPPPENDPETDLPKVFSDRKFGVLRASGVGPEAAKMVIKADAAFASGDMNGGREALEKATALDPRLLPAHLTLALLYEQAGDFDKAIDRYRAIVAITPNDFLSLNNLAYALAVHKSQAAEALPLAEKAFKLSAGNVQVADTLGWIHFLLGHLPDAEKFLSAAATASRGNPNILLHLAELYAAEGRNEEATAIVTKITSQDPTFDGRDDVKALKAKLQKK